MVKRAPVILNRPFKKYWTPLTNNKKSGGDLTMKAHHMLLTLLLMFNLSGVVSNTIFKETRELAKQGDANAQFNLGAMYTNGVDVPENDIEADKWL